MAAALRAASIPAMQPVGGAVTQLFPRTPVRVYDLLAPVAAAGASPALVGPPGRRRSPGFAAEVAVGVVPRSRHWVTTPPTFRERARGRRRLARDAGSLRCARSRTSGGHWPRSRGGSRSGARTVVGDSRCTARRSRLSRAERLLLHDATHVRDRGSTAQGIEVRPTGCSRSGAVHLLRSLGAIARRRGVVRCCDPTGQPPVF